MPRSIVSDMSKPAAPSVSKCREDVDDTNDAMQADASKFRTILPQFLACMPKNLLLFDLGLAIGFSTIVIPVLRGMQNDRNPDETLHFTAEQSSWFGSLMFLTQPIGSLMSGWVTEQIGRKRAMLLANTPHLIAWTMLGMANSIEVVFAAGILLSLGVGLMESSIITYVGEISHPSIRGILLALANICVMAGIFSMYVLGSLTTWRSAAFISLTVPIVTTVALLFVPETPYWLLSQKRPADAMRSLQWLRGWVSSKAVATEFGEMTVYISAANACDACRMAAISPCPHPCTYLDKIKDLLRAKTVRPFLVLSSGFVVVMCNGNLAVRPFLVQLARLMRMPIDPNLATILVGSMDILANVVVMLFVKCLGKRKIFLFSLVTAVCVCFGLSWNAYRYVPSGLNSFDNSTGNVPGPKDNWTGLVLILALAFIANVSMSVPWSMISEVYPFRVRGTVSGISAAFSYLTAFVSTKTYIDLERSLSISGAFLLYGILTCIGLVVQYLILPETEGKTLEEIEVYFSDKTRRITDRHIRPILNNETTTTTTPVRRSNGVHFDNQAFEAA